MKKILLVIVIGLLLLSFVSAVSRKEIESTSGFACISIKGSEINEDKNAYDNCKDKGYENFCLVDRTITEAKYSGLDCSSDLDWEKTISANLGCANEPKRDYTFCNSPTATIDGIPQGSRYNGYKDDIICCETPEPMECNIYGGVMIDEGISAKENCQNKGYNYLCLMNRRQDEMYFSSSDCRLGYQYEAASSSTLSCDNKPERGDSPVCEVTEQGSKSVNPWDGVVCCDILRECTDSDGGEDYYVKGTVNDIDGQEFTDRCTYPSILIERTCNPSTGSASVTNYDCPNGCSDGACLQEDTIKQVEEEKEETENHLLVVDDKGPVTDVVIISDLGVYLQSIGYTDIAPAKLNSEVTKDMLDDKVTTFVYNGQAVIIVGARSPSEHVILSQKIAKYLLDEEAIIAKNILNSDVNDDDLRKLFGDIPKKCTDSDGGKDYYLKGIGELAQQHEDHCRYGKLLEHYCDNSGILKKNDYFFVTASGTDRLLRYKGSDICSQHKPIAKFDDVDTGERYEALIKPDATFTLKLYKDKINFKVIDCSIDDSDIELFNKPYLMEERYECPNVCSDGSCVMENKKDMASYSDKETFLISDTNWKNVLPLVPLTTWTGDENCQKGTGTPDNVCVYPTLIYHEEAAGFDIDSIVYFMQQYSPDRVTIIGDTPQELDDLLIAPPELGAGLTQDQIQRIYPADYLSYWTEYKDVLYVKDNYESALLASSYASLINAPLVIQGTISDTENVFIGRNIICIGSASPAGSSCNENYNLEELRQKYVDETNTDKIILVNPNDLDIKLVGEFQPEKTSTPIHEIYSRTSLSAPILASAKHELIISTSSTDHKDIANYIKQKIGILTPYIINNENGIEGDNFKNPTIKLFKKNILTGNIDPITFLLFEPQDIHFYNNQLIIRVGSKFFSYDLQTDSIQEILPFLIGRYDFYFNKLVYLISDESGYHIYLKDIDTNENLLINSYQEKIRQVAIYNNIIAFLKKNTDTTCTGTAAICTDDSDCGKYCSVGGQSCEGDLDCSDEGICLTGSCRTRYGIYIYDLNTKEEKRVTPSAYEIDIYDNKIIWHNLQNIYLYDIPTEQKELIASPSGYSKIFENSIIWLDQDFNLYLYDIATNQTDLISSNILVSNYMKPEIYENKIIWTDFADTNDKYCEFSEIPCSISSDCPGYCGDTFTWKCSVNEDCESGDCYSDLCSNKPVALHMYDIVTGQKQELQRSKVTSATLYNNNLFYVSEKRNIFFIYGFLTIFAAPNAIPFREEMTIITDRKENYRSLDHSEYGDIYLEDRHPDLSVGRIQGITLSDVSSYVARDLFYENIGKTNNMHFLANAEATPVSNIREAENWTNNFKNAGYNAYCNAVSWTALDWDTSCVLNENTENWPSLYENRDLIYHIDHGSPSWASISYGEIPYLANSIVYNDACLTCSTYDQYSFCNNVIRKGGLGHIGAVSIATSANNLFRRTMNGVYYDRLTLGESFAKSYEYSFYRAMGNLLGDPTLDITPDYNLEEELR